MLCGSPSFASAIAAAKLLQSCPTLCNPMDGSPPGSPVPRILQARTLEWVAISFSSAWKWKVKVKSLSHIRLFATPRTAAYQAPLSMGFSKQEYWSGVPLPSPLHLLLPLPKMSFCPLVRGEPTLQECYSHSDIFASLTGPHVANSLLVPLVFCTCVCNRI